MVSARFLSQRIAHYYRLRGYEVEREVKLGNCIIDLAATHPKTGEKVAIEVKATGDDLIRGLGQLAEAPAWGYDEVVMVTGRREAESIALKVFQHHGFGLAGIDSRGVLTWIMVPREVPNRSGGGSGSVEGQKEEMDR